MGNMPRALQLFRIREYEEFLERARESKDFLKDLYEYYSSTKSLARARAARAWSARISDERISFTSPSHPGNALEGSLEYSLAYKIPFARGEERAYVEGRVRCLHLCWVRRRSDILALFDIPYRGLARTLAEGISLAILGRPDALLPLRLGLDDLEALEAWIKGNGGAGGGALIRSVFTGVTFGGARLDEMSLRRAPLEDLELYEELKKSSRRWKYLTLVTPPIEEVGARLTCRLSDGGGVIVYGRVELSAIDALLARLEEVLGLRVR